MVLMLFPRSLSVALVGVNLSGFDFQALPYPLLLNSIVVHFTSRPEMK